MKKQTIFCVMMTFIIMLSACYKDDFVNASDDVIKFETAANTVLTADGASLLPVKIKLNQEADRNSRSITVTLVNGKFRDGSSSTTVIANDDGIATVYVSSTGSGYAYVTAISGSWRSELSIMLLPAIPSRIIVTSSNENLQNSGASGASITAVLQRDTGACSAGLTIVYSAVDSVGQSHGCFVNIQPSDANASSRAVFRVNDPFTGTLYIKAKYGRVPGDSITGENLVFIHD